jgi:uncharacterized protein YjbJ (UPF0337 family)
MGTGEVEVETRLHERAAVAAGRSDIEECFHMGMDDKASNKAEDLKGKAKETAGKATDDKQMESEGKTDQSKSSLKQAGENVKDAFKG